MVIGNQTMERFIKKHLPALLSKRHDLMKKYAWYVAYPEYIDDAKPTDIDDIRHALAEIEQIEKQIGYMHKSCPEAAPSRDKLRHAGLYFDIPDCFVCGASGRLERGQWICDECNEWIDYATT